MGPEVLSLVTYHFERVSMAQASLAKSQLKIPNPCYNCRQSHTTVSSCAAEPAGVPYPLMTELSALFWNLESVKAVLRKKLNVSLLEGK